MSEGGARRILIVDDADEARAILAIAMRTIGGATVETADSAETALRVMDGGAVDVLITDFRMSGMSGLELLASLRASGHWPYCGSVLISGETDPDLPRRARDSGASKFFPKPFSAIEIRKFVIALLESCTDGTRRG